MICISAVAILTRGVPGVVAEAPGQVGKSRINTLHLRWVTRQPFASPLGYTAAILTRGVPGVAAETPGLTGGGKVTTK